jgi:SAM-dependent methyltransferase
VAQAAAAFAVERLRRDPGCRLRFLELGAGTGGTAEAVLAALEARGVPVEEYLFTDLSKTFLTFARTVLPHQPAWLSFATFDVEAPPESQGIAADRYDLVLATNVLQATRDLRATLRHAKAALRTNGLLVLNETSHNSLFHHLTFGLLDGWWLYSDPELRAPGGPALLPETWGKVLAQEGFRATVFPAEAVHPWGQQILLAESDGFVRRTRAARAVMPRPLPVATEEPAAVRRPPAQALDRSAAAVAEAMGRPREEALGYLLALFRLMAAETLGIDPETIGSRSRPFADTLLGELGMDSLSSNSLRNALRRDLGVDLAVHRIISEKVGSLLAELYEQLLLKHVSHAPHGGDAEETETFVF